MKSYKCLVILMVIAVTVASLDLCGCKKSSEEETVVESLQLCTDCGHIKGSDLCCQPDQPKCQSCGLVKGSPGCCKIPKDAETAAICTKCGQIKGSDLCCKPDQTKCPMCGLVKDSPGCCKLPKI